MRARALSSFLKVIRHESINTRRAHTYRQLFRRRAPRFFHLRQVLLGLPVGFAPAVAAAGALGRGFRVLPPCSRLQLALQPVDLVRVVVFADKKKQRNKKAKL